VLQALHEQPTDLLAFSFLSYEGIPPYSMLLREADRLSSRELSDRVVGITGLIRDYLGQLREQTDAPFLLHNASGLPLTRYRGRLPFLQPLSGGRARAVRALNEAIGELVEHVPNTILIDEDEIARRYGHRACAREVLPPRIARRALFHTAHFGGHLVSSYTDIVQSYRALRKAKVLLVDFDNTLWDGVMADGVVAQHHEFQRLLRKVKDAGMLLVAASKNDPTNIRWAEMSLAPDDFVLHKINWNPKVQSIREVAQELDLGLDSFVFIDDNPVERDLVRRELPMVCTLDPAEPATGRWIERLLRFPNTRETAEARQRTELYRQRAKRREALSQAVDYPAMMRSLALEVRFGMAAPGDLGRISELIQRTNQFNTTTIRYSTPELRGFLADDTHRIYVAELSDKFGSVGLVAVAIVERHDDSCTFDSFVMSCRAMGFELERLVLGLVIAEEDREGAVRCVGRVIPTARNTPALSLYSANGFTACSETEWVLEPDAPRPASPVWFTVRARRRGRLPQAALVRS
jgi:FkbH-like protein